MLYYQSQKLTLKTKLKLEPTPEPRNRTDIITMNWNQEKKCNRTGAGIARTSESIWKNGPRTAISSDSAQEFDLDPNPEPKLEQVEIITR